MLDPVDDIDLLLARTRVLLVPSLWAEARSRIVLEAMLRGVPVMAANVGGIPEAKMGVPYLLPVNPIAKYETRLDEQMVPVAEVPPQDIEPWREALERLLTDRDALRGDLARIARGAALEYAAKLDVGPLRRTAAAGEARREAPAPRRRARPLEYSRRRRRKLLALLPAQAGAGRRLVSGRRTPHRGRGCSGFPMPAAGRGSPAGLAGWSRRPGPAAGPRIAPCRSAVRTHGAAGGSAGRRIEPYLDRPFAFFGHSMGAVVAFELARRLRRRGLPLPRDPDRFRRARPAVPPQSCSAARARPRGAARGTAPAARHPAGILDDPALMRAILPALEADAALYRNYVYAEDAPLASPSAPMAARKIPNITSRST